MNLMLAHASHAIDLDVPNDDRCIQFKGLDMQDLHLDVQAMDIGAFFLSR